MLSRGRKSSFSVSSSFGSAVKAFFSHSSFVMVLTLAELLLTDDSSIMTSRDKISFLFTGSYSRYTLDPASSS